MSGWLAPSRGEFGVGLTPGEDVAPTITPGDLGEAGQSSGGEVLGNCGGLLDDAAAGLL